MVNGRNERREAWERCRRRGHSRHVHPLHRAAPHTGEDGRHHPADSAKWTHGRGLGGKRWMRAELPAPAIERTNGPAVATANIEHEVASPETSFVFSSASSRKGLASVTYPGDGSALELQLTRRRIVTLVTFISPTARPPADPRRR